MPIKHPQFVNGEIYHIIVRGIAGQKTFLDDKDRLRYLFNLYKFNNKNIVIRNPSYREAIPVVYRDGFPVLLETEREKPRDLLIELLAVCLVPNHIHLLVRQADDGGVSLFFQKMGGYASYFNKKYQRFGSLFQRPFKAIHIKTNDQLLIVTTYIHLNLIDLIEPNWKIKGISDPQKIMDFLETYPWSSYPYYLGKSNLSWLINSDFLNKILKRPEDFRNFVKARIFQKTELKNFLERAQKISLE